MIVTKVENPVNVKAKLSTPINVSKVDSTVNVKPKNKE